MSASLGAEGRGAAAPGLVSVPTSDTRGVEALRLAESIDAFVLPDKDVARLARMRRSIGFAARAIAVQRPGHRKARAWMVTLTYRPGVDWQPKHISDAIKAYRQWTKRQGIACEYVWVAELQKRGAVHYHGVFWLPVGVRMPKWDSQRAWWPHGMAHRVMVKRSAVGYLMKYLSKGTSFSAFPKGARTFGVGGLDQAMSAARKWLRAPAYVRGNASVQDQFRPAKGGGWTINGVRFAAEFRTVLVGGLRACQRVLRHAVAIEAHGPFSWLRPA